MSERSGKIQTVTGLLDPANLGRTLTHEHLFIGYDFCYFPPAREEDIDQTAKEFSMENLGWIRQNPYSHKPNLHFINEDVAIIEELKYMKKIGGSSLVDCTNLGIGRDVKKLNEYSKASGVNIVAGAGFYVNAVHPPEMSSMKEEELVQIMVNDITKGVDGSNIKCGIIGEIGCCWPLPDNEKKVLRAAAVAQVQTGAPVNIHPGRNPRAPAEIIRILQEAGGDISKTCISHLDRTIPDMEDLLEFAKMGSYLEYDLFGMEVVSYQFNEEMDMPSDPQRVQYIKNLIDEGYSDHLVISHDIHTKHRLMKYGGHGYSHIYLNILPKMLKRGISQEVIDKIMIHNPRKLLTFK